MYAIYPTWQAGSQITGSSNNFAVFSFYRYTCRSKTNKGVCDYVRNIWMSTNHGRRYLLTNIKDGSQLTGSTDISEAMTYTINIPTTNLRHSTMANSQEVYLGDSNNDRQSETAAETGNTYLWNCEKYS